MTEKLTPYDPADFLKTEEDIANYIETSLEAALEDNDPTLIARALGAVARAKGLSQIAQQTGLGRQNLYKALSGDKDPRFSTVMKTFDALGLHLTVARPRKKRSRTITAV